MAVDENVGNPWRGPKFDRAGEFPLQRGSL